MSSVNFDEVNAFELNGIEFDSAVHEFYRTYRQSGLSGEEAIKLAIQTAEASISGTPGEHRAAMREALYKVKGKFT